MPQLLSPGAAAPEPPRPEPVLHNRGSRCSGGACVLESGPAYRSWRNPIAGSRDPAQPETDNATVNKSEMCSEVYNGKLDEFVSPMK